MFKLVNDWPVWSVVFLLATVVIRSLLRWSLLFASLRRHRGTVVGTIPKPRKVHGSPELGLGVSQLKNAD